MFPSPHPQSHNLSNRDEKPTLLEVGLSSALPTKGPEPNQLTLELVAAEGEFEGVGCSGRLFGLG